MMELQEEGLRTSHLQKKKPCVGWWAEHLRFVGGSRAGQGAAAAVVVVVGRLCLGSLHVQKVLGLYLMLDGNQ